MIQPNYYFFYSFRVRLLRGAGSEDGRAPLRGHDGVVPHVRHLRHVLHAPSASQGMKTAIPLTRAPPSPRKISTLLRGNAATTFEPEGAKLLVSSNLP